MEKIKHFWDWVEANTDNIFAEESTLQSASFKTLLSELKEIDPDLEARLDSQTKTLMISPSGYLDLLDLVDQIAEACPIKDRLNCSACFPRGTPPSTVVIDTNQYSLDQFEYLLCPGRGLVNILIAIPNFSVENERNYEELVFNLLDSILGERDVITKVGDIIFCSSDDLDGDRQNLSKLQEHFDAFAQEFKETLENRRQLPSDKRLSESFKNLRAKLANQIGYSLDLAEDRDTKSACEVVFMGDSEESAQQLSGLLQQKVGGIVETNPSRSLLGSAVNLSISFPIKELSGSDLFKLVNELAQLSIEYNFEMCDVQLITV